jgi:menaquinone-dependent protoporphyrinogen oxidase
MAPKETIMEDTILVAHASKYGATTEIAEKIGQVIRQVGLNADVLPVNSVDVLSAYQAVVLGSAVYAGRWRKEAVAFLEAHEETLAAMPVWFFSTGPTGKGDPVELMRGWRFPEALQPLADRIRPCDIAIFHGVLDMKKLSFGEKLVVKGFKAPIGDFRDWDAITAWATAIAKAPRKEKWQSDPIP